MTIQELKEKKQALEKEINDKLMKFEVETMTKIISVNIDIVDIEPNMDFSTFYINIKAGI